MISNEFSFTIYGERNHDIFSLTYKLINGMNIHLFAVRRQLGIESIHRRFKIFRNFQISSEFFEYILDFLVGGREVVSFFVAALFAVG